MNDPLYTLLQEKGLPMLGCWEGRVEFERLLTPAEAAMYRKIIKSGKPALTRRHLQLLRMAAQGCANKQIAQKYGIAYRTVKVHFTEIYKRLGAVDRASAVATAIRQGIL